MNAVSKIEILMEPGSVYSPVHGRKQHPRGDFINYDCRGLRNIYLRNGYTLHSADDGVFARVEKPLELEREVVLACVESACPLSGEAFRFLRKRVSMTRSELARLLGTKARDVLMWEYQRKEIPVVAEFVMRALAKEHFSGFAELALTASVIGCCSEKHAKTDIQLEYVNERWSRVED